MADFQQPQMREFMVGYTAQDYNYSAGSMDLYIPELMMDKGNGGTSNISIPSDIFKSKENIHVATTVANNGYITIKVSAGFTGAFKALEYDNFVNHPSPQFPKGSRMVVYIPNGNIDQAVVVPFI
jgi:hypothetical protein